MAKYAHIKNGAVFKIKDMTAEEIADIPAHKARYILPYTEAPRPVYDSSTHHPPIRQPDDIQAKQVLQVWLAPVAKTQVELDAEESDAQDNIMDMVFTRDRMLKATHTMIFNLLNDVRILKGEGVITQQQYRNFLKSQL